MIIQFLLALIAIMLAACSPTNVVKFDWGEKANIENWPFMAHIVYYAVGGEAAVAACGGALLSSQTALTAAHCLDEPTGYKLELFRYKIKILMGSSDIVKATMIRTVSDYQTHYEYKLASSYADIAVAFLEKPVQFSATVKKTILQPTPPDNSVVFVAGWGVWKNPLDHKYKTLYSINVTIFSNKRCKSKIRDFREGMLCAGDFNSPKFRFGGDSGGPLVTGIGYQIGLVSYTASDSVTVYTSTWHYLKWIKKTQSQLFQNNCGRLLDTLL